jgi:hypothetical protein
MHEVCCFAAGYMGTIPLSSCNLTNLVDLELQNNALSGSIPDSLGNSKTLRFLYVILLY